MLRELARPPAFLRPPRALALVRDASPDEVNAEVDWTPWHLEEDDDVGQSPEQGLVIHAVCSALRERLRELGRATTFVDADSFFAWVEEAPLVRVSPDVYTLEAPPPQPLPRMFQTWLAGHVPPAFALEVVSEAWKKDYQDAPAKYALLGAKELVIFDADATRGTVRAPRVPLQVFRRKADGAFVQVYAGPGPARADTIDAWLVATPTTDSWQLLRLARDPEGTDLVPTGHERGENESRRADDEKRRADEANRRAEEANRRADDEKRLAGEANRRAEALEAELARLRRDPARQGD